MADSTREPGAGLPWRVAVLGFDHMHAGDQLRLAAAHPRTALVGACDDRPDDRPDRARRVLDSLGLPPSLLYTDVDELLTRASPQIVVVCSTTADHVRWTEYLAAHQVHVVVEKPFASSLPEADRMIAAMRGTGRTLTVNWPLAWYPSHRTTRRLIAEGAIGAVVAVHYYDGNRGPLHHEHDKHEVAAGDDVATKNASWWYRRADGGGSLMDYLGYGVTLGTWFRNGELPTEVTAVTHVPAGLEVDEQSVVVAAYPGGLSTFQTRWGTVTDPWTVQSAPRCGFTVVGSAGALTSWDYAEAVTLHTDARPEGEPVPVDVPGPAERDHLGLLVDALDRGVPVTGPSSWEISRAGQRIVDAAVLSARLREPVPLPGTELPTRPVAARTGARP
jgi:glucose-fructose oxidoreductase